MAAVARDRSVKKSVRQLKPLASQLVSQLVKPWVRSSAKHSVKQFEETPEETLERCVGSIPLMLVCERLSSSMMLRCCTSCASFCLSSSACCASWLCSSAISELSAARRTHLRSCAAAPPPARGRSGARARGRLLRAPRCVADACKLRERDRTKPTIASISRASGRAAGSRGVLGVGLLQTAAELLRVSERRRGDGDDGVADGALDGVAVAHALGAEREVRQSSVSGWTTALSVWVSVGPQGRHIVGEWVERVGECVDIVGDCVEIVGDWVDG